MDFTELCLQADFYFSLDVNVIVISNMNSNSSKVKLHNFLEKWIDLIISRTMKPESTSKATLFEIN